MAKDQMERNHYANVRTSAPAKVILFGEHAVVYGCPAIATTVTNLRIFVDIKICEAISPRINFIFNDIPSHHNSADPLTYQLSFEKLNVLMKDLRLPEESIPLHPPRDLLSQIAILLNNEPSEHYQVLQSSIFLCAIHFSTEFLKDTIITSIDISVSGPNFPLGAGLGSSAAFSVAFSGALTAFCSRSSKLSLESVNRCAFASEILIHGTPSGVDNTVSTFGHSILFQKNIETGKAKIDPLLHTQLRENFQFLIVNTKVPRSTKDLVAAVRYLYTKNPSQVQQIFDKIACIVNEFIEFHRSNALTEERLANLIVQNQSHLRKLNVSHPAIELVISTTQKYGMATKLTGAGGGGCTISLIPSDLSEVHIVDAIQELEKEGFECFRSTLGGVGLQVSDTSSGNEGR